MSRKVKSKVLRPGQVDIVREIDYIIGKAQEGTSMKDSNAEWQKKDRVCNSRSAPSKICSKLREVER